MVSLLDLFFYRDLLLSQQAPPPGSSQSAQGKNIKEVSYQEGSTDMVGTMVIILLVLGALLFCLRAAIGHFLRRQTFQKRLPAATNIPENKVQKNLGENEQNGNGALSGTLTRVQT